MLSLSRAVASAAASAAAVASPARGMSALAGFKAVNEPCLGFLPGSKERTDLEAALLVSLRNRISGRRKRRKMRKKSRSLPSLSPSLPTSPFCFFPFLPFLLSPSTSLYARSLPRIFSFLLCHPPFPCHPFLSLPCLPRFPIFHAFPALFPALCLLLHAIRRCRLRAKTFRS